MAIKVRSGDGFQRSIRNFNRYHRDFLPTGPFVRHDGFVTTRRAAIQTARLAALALLGTLGGCGDTGAWHWTAQQAGHHDQPAAVDGPAVPHGHADRVDPGVAVFGRSAYIAEAPPEASRRDGVLMARTPDGMPDRLAWPRERRPDLRTRGTITTSTTAQRWVYPDDRRDRVYRHYRYGW